MKIQIIRNRSVTVSQYPRYTPWYRHIIYDIFDIIFKWCIRYIFYTLNTVNSIPYIYILCKWIDYFNNVDILRGRYGLQKSFSLHVQCGTIVGLISLCFAFYYFWIHWTNTSKYIKQTIAPVEYDKMETKTKIYAVDWMIWGVNL